MEFMPGHGVGAGFAGAVMAKQRKTIPATLNVARVIASLHITLSSLCVEQKGHNPPREVLGNHADNLSKAGWSLGWVSAVDRHGRTIWIADAHRGDGKRFVVHADEKLTAFVELEAAIRACGDCA
jgi:hypothetical protein